MTSGTGPLVAGWLGAMGLARPRVLVAAEDVGRGKPDPECYALGRARLAVPDGAAALVLEDAPAGIRAGRAAGCKVVALATTHSIARLREAGADWIVRDMRSVRLVGWDGERGEVRIGIEGALVDG